ncbi:MAG TPA: VOC family protein [Solirubrobacteraceae bacterium]|nr:VOC family protein [Solirubrobacteraceae bacterium]
MSSVASGRLKGMTTDVPVTLALPIAERAAALAFYRDALGLEAFGAPGSDGIPEPLQFAVNEGLTLMLVPTGGFGWVIGDREVAEPWACECLLSLDAPDPAAVDALVARAAAAGASVVVEPAQQPWGYAGTFADLDGHLWSVVAMPA